MYQPQWIRLNRDQAQRVLRQLGTDKDAVVFSLDVTDVSWHALPFYSNYRVYRLINYATMPVFTLTYLSNGEEYMVLDGTANPIYTVNEKDPLRLSEDNIVAYLEFFFKHVQGSEGDVTLIHDANKMPFIGTVSEAQKDNIIRSFRPLQVFPDPANQCFKVNGTLHYGGGLVAAEILVTSEGKISFQDQSLVASGVQMPVTRIAPSYEQA